MELKTEQPGGGKTAATFEAFAVIGNYVDFRTISGKQLRRAQRKITGTTSRNGKVIAVTVKFAGSQYFMINLSEVISIYTKDPAK